MQGDSCNQEYNVKIVCSQRLISSRISLHKKMADHLTVGASSFVPTIQKLSFHLPTRFFYQLKLFYFLSRKWKQCIFKESSFVHFQWVNFIRFFFVKKTTQFYLYLNSRSLEAKRSRSKEAKKPKFGHHPFSCYLLVTQNYT